MPMGRRSPYDYPQSLACVQCFQCVQHLIRSTTCFRATAIALQCGVPAIGSRMRPARLAGFDKHNRTLRTQCERAPICSLT